MLPELTLPSLSFCDLLLLVIPFLKKYLSEQILCDFTSRVSESVASLLHKWFTVPAARGFFGSHVNYYLILSLLPTKFSYARYSLFYIYMLDLRLVGLRQIFQPDETFLDLCFILYDVIIDSFIPYNVIIDKPVFYDFTCITGFKMCKGIRWNASTYGG